MKKIFWKNKKVLITGHTGFKGSWLVLILHALGAKIYGYALNPVTKPNLFDSLNLKKYLEKDYRANILNQKKLKHVLEKVKPSILIHLAAQSEVLESYKFPKKTIETNIIGTMNILELIKKAKFLKSAIIVTTDKVYLNLEKKLSFNEGSKLGGTDIYSSSKAAVEILTSSYTKSFFKNHKCKIATVRSGNCIGGGDWSRNRILKDCVTSFAKNKNLIVRSPESTRPWQHVIEPLVGYLKLSEKLFFDKKEKYVGAWNFGPKTKNNLKVKELAYFGKKIFRSKSKIIFKKNAFYESKNLSLNSMKAFEYLNWKTLLSAKVSLKMTFEWYKKFYDKKSNNEILKFTFNQIKDYLKKLK